MSKTIKASTQNILRLICVCLGVLLIIIGALIWPTSPENGLIPMYEDIKISVMVICVGIVFCVISIAGDILARVVEQAKQPSNKNETELND